MTVVAGATIGPYRIIEQIGRGGMATVYKAYQAALARNVAIKVLPAFFAEDAGFRDRFQQEAIAVAKLRHPNILAVFDYGEENGVTYIASEFVDGGTLADQLGTPLPTDYVWTATFDASEFRGFPGIPDEGAATVRGVPGAIEMAIMRPESRTALEFEKLPSERYFVEWDVELGGPHLLFDVRLNRAAAGLQQLRLATDAQSLYLEGVRCAGETCAPTGLTQPTSVPSIRAGGRITIGVAAGPTGYVVFVDGARIAEAPAPPIGRPMLGAEVSGSREGVVRITGLRLYELRGPLP